MRDINQLIDSEKTLVVCNHSGGKDSQAMYLFLKQVIPGSRLVVIHANLPGVEWPGTIEHIEETVEDHPIYVVTAGKTFFEMVKRRGHWPSPKYRQCTSDLKRGPIAKKIRQLVKDGGFDTVINCMGLRAAESSARAKKEVFKLSNRNTTQNRTWFEWLPIHDWSTKAVFDYIKQNGQDPHWAYEKGMSRLSCCFCIMSSKSDLQIAARLRPDLLQQYIEIEQEIDQTFIMPKSNGNRLFLNQIIDHG